MLGAIRRNNFIDFLEEHPARVIYDGVWQYYAGIDQLDIIMHSEDRPHYEIHWRSYKESGVEILLFKLVVDCLMLFSSDHSWVVREDGERKLKIPIDSIPDIIMNEFRRIKLEERGDKFVMLRWAGTVCYKHKDGGGAVIHMVYRKE